MSRIVRQLAARARGSRVRTQRVASRFASVTCTCRRGFQDASAPRDGGGALETGPRGASEMQGFHLTTQEVIRYAREYSIQYSLRY